MHKEGFFDSFLFSYAICGILILLTTWLIACRKEEFKISATVTILYLFLIALIFSFCTIISSGIIDYFHYIYYEIPDMMNPIKRFTESFVRQRFSFNFHVFWGRFQFHLWTDYLPPLPAMVYISFVTDSYLYRFGKFKSRGTGKNKGAYRAS